MGEYDATGALIEETVWLGDIPVATLRPNGATVAIYYVHSDHDTLFALLRVLAAMKRTDSIGPPIVGLLMLASAPHIAHAGEAARGNTSSRTCSEAVTSFVADPTASNYERIRRLRADACRSTLTQKQIQSLNNLIAAGNGPAARLLAQHVRRLDGGELEDTLRAFGQYSLHDMQDFLTLITTDALTPREGTDALTMLPLELEDQFDAQLAALRARRTAVERVHDAQLQGAAKSALDAINTFVSEIERSRTGQGSAK